MGELCRPAFVGLLVEELRLLSGRQRMEYVAYHALSAGFGSLGDALLM